MLFAVVSADDDKVSNRL